METKFRCAHLRLRGACAIVVLSLGACAAPASDRGDADRASDTATGRDGDRLADVAPRADGASEGPDAVADDTPVPPPPPDGDMPPLDGGVVPTPDVLVMRDTGAGLDVPVTRDATSVDAPVTPADVVTGPSNVVIDATRTYQTWRGWEATIGGTPAYTAALRDAVIRAAVDDLGINRLRIQVAGNLIETLHVPTGNPDQPYEAANDDADPNHINPAGFDWSTLDNQMTNWVAPMKARVESRGEPFVANVCYVGFRASTSFQQTIPAEYAEFAFAVMDHLRSSYPTFPVDVWEARLEPDVGYTITGTQLGQNIVAAGNRLHAAGWAGLRFAAPTASHPTNLLPLTSAVLAVPGASPMIRELTYHRYGTPAAGELAMLWTQAQALHVETAMLEEIGATQNELYDDLTQANNSSWQRFTLSYPGTGAGAGTYYITDTTAGTYVMSTGTPYLRQYMRTIRPGMVRLDASSTNAAIRPVVFRAPSGRTVVVANVASAATLRVGGLPAGTYQVTFATATQPTGTAPAVTIRAGEVLVVSMPAAGVIALAP